MLILRYSIGAPFCPSDVAENELPINENTVGPEPELIPTDKHGGVCARITVITCVSSFTSAGVKRVAASSRSTCLWSRRFTRSMLQREEMKLPRVSAHMQLSLPL